MRAKLMNAVTVLGSATPSLESYYNARAGKYRLLGLPERVDNVPMPHVEIIDMREERRREHAALKQAQGTARPREWRKSQQGALSETMKEKILDRMSRKEGIILLQNRRGFAPFVECLDCGYCEECERCSVTLTYHLAQRQLRCHYCGTVYRPHTTCPRCGSASLVLRGIGTQRVEEELAKEIPAARVLRMDLDTTTGRGSHERILRKFGEGGADILLGTQMVAKGLDFPRVTLVGVISADTQMLLPDFRSAERTFQLLTQVAGRSGRSTLLGEVLIQSHQPDHYALTHVLDHDYRAFYEQEIGSRQELDYPPFSRLVLIEFKGKNESEVRAEAERVRDLLRVQNGVLSLLGPAPAVIAKINEQYRWHIIIKSLRSQDPSGSALRHHVRNSLAQSARGRRRSVRVIVDVDPVGML
jgi:primosomal protein N' (replication factor Y)